MLIDNLVAAAKAFGTRLRSPPGPSLPNESAAVDAISSESGYRPTPENSLAYMYRSLWCDPALRAAILEIRDMDRKDGRVKRIHSRIARDIVKGGLVFKQAKTSPALSKRWDDFQRRMQLNRAEKLRSDARGLVMEGNLPLQWILDPGFNVIAGIRMPSETIIPQVDESGRFTDLQRAYVQLDAATGRELATFPLWQLYLSRFDPDNFDDMGAMGRPFLDASRETWKKLRMTEEDLVIRRRTRAPLRLSHVLENATKPEIEEYRKTVENDQGDITTDFYSSKKGGVGAIQGDSNLDQIADVVHLLDTFFAGTPLPKGLMGYTNEMARDILQDLKTDYYEEIDGLQDTLSFGYDQGFRLDLLLHDINPDAEDYTIGFAERRTETPNQVADRALKWQALGVPQGIVFEEMGMDPAYVKKRKDAEAKDFDPYPEPDKIGSGKVTITPNNAPKGESATNISNK